MAPASASPRARGSGSRRGRRRRRSAPPPAPRRTPPARAASACCRAARGACSGAPARPAAAAAARAARSTSASSSRRCALPVSRRGGGWSAPTLHTTVRGVVQSAMLTRPASGPSCRTVHAAPEDHHLCPGSIPRTGLGLQNASPACIAGAFQASQGVTLVRPERPPCARVQPAPVRAVRGARAAGPGRAGGAAGGVRGPARRAARAHAARRVCGRRGQREPLRAVVRPRRRQEVEDQHLAGRRGRPAGDGAPPLAWRRVLRPGRSPVRPLLESPAASRPAARRAVACRSHATVSCRLAVLWGRAWGEQALVSGSWPRLTDVGLQARMCTAGHHAGSLQAGRSQGPPDLLHALLTQRQAAGRHGVAARGRSSACGGMCAGHVGQAGRRVCLRVAGRACPSVCGDMRAGHAGLAGRAQAGPQGAGRAGRQRGGRGGVRGPR
jgi:hypothetical protein